MPTVQGINVSQLVADEALMQFVLKCPMASFGGKLGEATWKDMKWSLNRSIDIPKRNFMIASQGMTAQNTTLVEETVPVIAPLPLNTMFPSDAYDTIFNYGGMSNDPKRGLGMVERVIEPSVRAIKVLLENRLMTEFGNNYYQAIGTPGTPLSQFSSITPINALADRMEIMGDNMCIFTSPENYSSLSAGVGAGSNAPFNPSYNNSIIRKLMLPEMADFGIMKTNFVQQHVFGTAYSDTTTVTTTMTDGSSTIQLTIGSGHTVLAGDLFEVEGVYSVSPTSKIPYGKLRGFVANVDATVSGTTATITLPTPLYATGPRQNVTALPQTGAAVTWKAIMSGANAGTVTKSYCLMPASYSVTSLTMPDLWGAENGLSRDKDSEMQFKVTKQGLVETYVNELRLDLAAVWRAFADYGIVILS
jgi:hypothetical protein